MTARWIVAAKSKIGNVDSENRYAPRENMKTTIKNNNYGVRGLKKAKTQVLSGTYCHCKTYWDSITASSSETPSKQRGFTIK